MQPLIKSIIRLSFGLSFFLAAHVLNAQLSYKVLFLGNSYTYVNNLPQLVHDVALSAGDTLIFDSYTPGGYQLIDHALDPSSQAKIAAGGWDYVVIQGQSQEPITHTSQFMSGGSGLYNQVKQYSPCAVVMPYMTWGRKNGDASNCWAFPVMCTYQGMDGELKARYLSLTASLNGEVSPVSVVWNYLRQHHPGIELYQADESHPSPAGTYAAACCFYASLFKKDPALITFNSGLTASDAAIIRNAAKTQVFDSLHLWNYKKLPVSTFNYQVGQGTNEIIFNPLNQGVQQTYLWDFGDGTTSATRNPTHAYAADGTYTVTLTTTNCNLQGSYTSISDTVIRFCSHTPGIYTSHAWLCHYDTLWTQTADFYQWYLNGVALPEANRYLANYAHYGLSGFSVMSTLAGCSELSAIYTETPDWSGYYFDVIGNPCAGDTVAFAVLHINGSLSGAEMIQWLRNDTLLPAMNNEDTLLITGEGSYECKVVDPNATCYLDTTSYRISYNCSTVGIEEKARESLWTVSPNPASETITIHFSKQPLREQIQIYNTTGVLMRSISVSAATIHIHIADLPGGLYYIRPGNAQRPALKWMKL